jgi:ABC-type dipeptide/oligopeptide/nickel transport system permease component
MFSYIVRRLLLMIPTLIGITVLVFSIMASAPGGIGAALRSSSGNMRPEQRREIEEYLKKQYGLDKPPYRQYLRWLNNVSPIGFKDSEKGFPNHSKFGFKMPDLGQSWLRRQPVIDIFKYALPITFLLNVVTIPIIYAVAVSAGIYAGKKRGKAFDVISGTAFMALWSIPTMCAGVLLLGFLASKDYWQWFPTGGLHGTLAESMPFLPHHTSAGWNPGWLMDVLWHLALPVLCLSYGGFAFLSKLMRSSVLENLSADFARTARAKGLSENAILFRHVVSNSVLPLITVAASILPGLFGGSVIVETIFSIEGMGKLMIDSIFLKDQDIVMAETLVVGAITLLSLLVADICYAMADPRVSYE